MSKRRVTVLAALMGWASVCGAQEKKEGEGTPAPNTTQKPAPATTQPSQAELDQLRQDGWIKDGETAWYNAGIYIFRPSLFEFTATLQKSARGEYELTDAITALIQNHHPLAGLRIEGRWVDVRDPEVLARLENE